MVWRMVLYDPFCHFVTLLMMYANGVRHESFHTNGTPIISVSYRNGGGITVGDNLRMNNGNAANNIGFCNPCTFIADGAYVYIHDNVGMSQTAVCAVGADITIGSNTLLGGGVRIYSSDFHSMNYKDRRDYKTADKKNRKSSPVVIGEDCFIGSGTVILKGVTIGDRTVIGAGSVVAKSIPADCIAAGNPCKVIKRIS